MKNMRNRLLAVLLCVLMLFAVAACNTGESTKAPETSQGSAPAGNTDSDSGSGSGSGPVKDTLNVAASLDYGTLAHENVPAGDMYSAINLVNEPLWHQYKMAAEKDVSFLLAESVELISPTEWIIHLKKGIKFSNGNPFTASDVIFSVRAVQASPVNGASRGQLMNMDKTKIIDDYTIDFIWDEYHCGQWGIISDILIYDEESYDPEVASTKPIGTGPYVVKEYVVNSHLFLERRDDYWGELPEFKYVNFRVLAEPSQINNALETGMIDIAQRISNEDVDYISSLPGIHVESYFDTNFARMGFNVSPASIMHNLEARYAVCHAIDRQAICDVVYHGRAQVLERPTCMTCLDDDERYDNMHETYSVGYNVDLAKQYAESSGLVGKKLRLMTNGTPEFVLMAEMIQEMLRQIGVETEIVNYDAATFTSLSKDDVSASAWDINVNLGLNPGYLVASTMIMAPKTYKILNTPGHWEGSEEYIPKAYSFYSTVDPKERADLTYWMLGVYEKQALTYGICDIQTSTAISKDIDPSTFVYRQNGGMYYAYVKTAK